MVTGSRIPRTGFETLQPATVLDSEKLELRGNVDLAAALNEQAGFTAPGISPVDGQLSDENGQNFVDYLGLGQQRTLTLVNSKRFPAAVSPTSVGGLSVDLNMIPENLVDRIETIAVGGAPIYGSDAISGTVNVILKDDFEGFEVFGQTGGSLNHGDAGRTRFGATWARTLTTTGATLPSRRSTRVLTALKRPIDRRRRPASASRRRGTRILPTILTCSRI